MRQMLNSLYDLAYPTKSELYNWTRRIRQARFILRKSSGSQKPQKGRQRERERKRERGRERARKANGQKHAIGYENDGKSYRILFAFTFALTLTFTFTFIFAFSANQFQIAIHQLHHHQVDVLIIVIAD